MSNNELEREVPAHVPISQPNVPGNLTATSLELPDGISSEDWLELVKTLFKSHKSMQWAIGDALVYGDKAFGHPDKPTDVYANVSWATGYDIAQLYDIASVSRSVPTSLRNEMLSWSHHRAVRQFDTEKQKYYLNLAAECRLSVARLRYEIQHDEGSRMWPVGPMTEGERLLLPPALQLPVGPEKLTPEDPKPDKHRGSPSVAKSFKSLELKTHMTRLEISALEQFAKGKAIDTDIAIRALVTLALHSSGDLQHVAEHSESVTEVDAEHEKSYLLYLGQTWFGDENKFPFDAENLPDLLGFINTSENTTKSRTSPAKVQEYIQTTARLLEQLPDMTAEDVQRNVGWITVSLAASILADARKLYEVRKEAKALKDKADEEERERRAKERKEADERLAKEHKEAEERRIAEAELLAALTVPTSDEVVDETTANDAPIDPEEDMD
jgi:hypothetical protein